MQSQHKAENTADSSTVTNPMVMGNNSNENSFSVEVRNKDSNSFLSELIINENQSFVSDQLRKEDMAAANAKQICEIHINDNDSFISDQFKDLDLEAQTIQKKKKRKQRKTISQTLIFQRTIAVIKGTTMVNKLIQKYTA